MSEDMVPVMKDTEMVVQEDKYQEAMEAMLVKGDLSKFSLEERNRFLFNLSKSLGLNPAMKPFDIMKTQDGRLLPYANKGAAEQLRGIKGVSLRVIYDGPLMLGATANPDVYVYRIEASMPDGRVDVATGAVGIKGLQGEALANAIMKCETKGKRRVTFSILGLNMLDETEVDSIPGGKKLLTGPRVAVPPTVQVMDEDLSTTSVLEAIVVPPKAAVAEPRKAYPPVAPPVAIARR